MNEKAKNKIHMQKKVQGIYREIKKQKEIEQDDNIIGKIIVNLCVVIILFFFIMSTLFDLGVQLPEFFGV
ncbi:hypothetical protein [Niallia sp. FSL R7-0271]|uniref:hypothetical protein n=1 Tax=Niallia sp. FSL R7-0271 TaxID=2921678 RepID=UPI0030F63CED